MCIRVSIQCRLTAAQVGCIRSAAAACIAAQWGRHRMHASRCAAQMPCMRLPCHLPMSQRRSPAQRQWRNTAGVHQWARRHWQQHHPGAFNWTAPCVLCMRCRTATSCLPALAQQTFNEFKRLSLKVAQPLCSPAGPAAGQVHRAPESGAARAHLHQRPLHLGQ